MGGMAPMPLETYKQVYDRRAVISYMASSGRMPPWGATRGIGTWANDASLSERDLADLLAWAKAAAPAGDPKDAPLARSGRGVEHREAGRGGADPRHVPRPGAGRRRVQVLVREDRLRRGQVDHRDGDPTDGGEGRAPRARLPRGAGAEARERPVAQAGRPGATGGRRRLLRRDRARRHGRRLPGGHGKRLPKGAWLKFQIHYQPNGTEQVDRTTIGFQFADRPLTEVQSRSAFTTRFEIPPHAPKHEVRATHTFRTGGTLLSLFPHMHLRGAAFRYELVKPDSTVEVLLDVPRFDFNWQSYYEFKEPKRVEAGWRLRAVAWYDNSKNNPFNPDPTKAVRFGEQTFEEMMIGYFDFVADPAPPAAPPPAPATPADSARSPPAGRADVTAGRARGWRSPRSRARSPRRPRPTQAPRPPRRPRSPTPRPRSTATRSASAPGSRRRSSRCSPPGAASAAPSSRPSTRSAAAGRRAACASSPSRSTRGAPTGCAVGRGAPHRHPGGARHLAVVLRTLGAVAVPTAVVVGGDGVVRWRGRGALRVGAPGLERALREASRAVAAAR
jgi:hypothetical protein